MKKVRVGSKVSRVYSPAQTPFERVLASGRTDARHMAELKKLRSTLDPFKLAQTIDRSDIICSTWWPTVGASKQKPPSAPFSR